MRILPVSLFKIRNIIQNSETAILPKLKPLPYDSVSFSAKKSEHCKNKKPVICKPMSAKAYKKMNKYVCDFYTGLPMLEDKQLEKMKERGFFTGPIREVVYKLKPYYEEEFFEPIEKEIFEMIIKAAEANPKMDLTSLFNTWYIAARKTLRKQQKPTFDKIKELGAQLPSEKMQQFYKFMATVDKMLYDEPIIKEFSYKDFSYKLENYIRKTSDNNTKLRIQKLLDQLKYVHTLEGDIPEKFIKQIYDFKNLKIDGKKNLYYQKHMKPLEKDKSAVKLKIIHDISKIAKMNGYKKVEKLCQTNMDMLNDLPVKIPFSNKAFKYDLAELLEDVPDKNLTAKMVQLADELPTSQNSRDAFILKMKDTDSNIIGDRLLNPSLVSIEHLVPDSLGGPDTMANCALARRGINSKRGNEPLYITLQKYDPKNQIKYAECVVKLQKREKIPYEDTLAHFETIEREGHLDLSDQKAKLIKPASL